MLRAGNGTYGNCVGEALSAGPRSQPVVLDAEISHPARNSGPIIDGPL